MPARKSLSVELRGKLILATYIAIRGTSGSHLSYDAPDSSVRFARKTAIKDIKLMDPDNGLPVYPENLEERREVESQLYNYEIMQESRRRAV
jgi:hypothetical protein